MTRPPNPWLAALLAILAPGVGHVYVDAPLRAAGIFATGLAVLLVGGSLVVQVPGGPLWMLIITLLAALILVGGAIDAWRQARRWERERPRPWWTRWYGVAAAIVVFTLTLTWIGERRKEQVSEAFAVPSGANAPGLRPGDYVLADRRASARTATRGRLALFRSVEDPALTVLFRVVAIGGDTVGMRDGVLWLNGKPQVEPYVRSKPGERVLEDAELLEMMRAWQARAERPGVDTTLAPSLSTWGPVVVPPAHFLALGDNRNASYDSRFWGFVPDSHVVGTPLYVYMHWGPDGGGPELARSGLWVR